MVPYCSLHLPIKPHNHDWIINPSKTEFLLLRIPHHINKFNHINSAEFNTVNHSHSVLGTTTGATKNHYLQSLLHSKTLARLGIQD